MTKIKRTATRKHIYFAVAVAVILASGIFLRVVHIGLRSLWMDEANLANLVNQNSLGEVLTQPFEALPPLLFVVLLHLVTRLIGAGEIALRCIPFLAGVAALPLVFVLAKEFFSRSTAVISLFLVSFSTILIYYSKELKQYSTEMLFSLLVVFTAERVITGKRPRDMVWFSLVSITGILISHSFVFVWPVVFVIVLYKGVRARARYVTYLLVLCIVIVLVFSVVYLSYTRNSISDHLYGFWRKHYVNWTSRDGFVHWNIKKMSHLARQFLNGTAFYVSKRVFFIPVGVLFLLGILDAAVKKKWRVLFYLLAPLVLLYLAASLQRYPLKDRLLIFVAPLPVILVANGISFLFAVTGKNRITLAVLLLLSGWIVFNYVKDPVKENLISPYRREELRPVVRWMEGLYEPGDAVFVYYRARPAFRYYWPFPESTYTVGSRSRDESLPELRRLSDKNRDRKLWLVFSNYMRGRDRRVGFLEVLNKERDPLSESSDVRASAHLFGPKKR